MIKTRQFILNSVSPEGPGGGSRYFTQHQVHTEFKEKEKKGKKNGLEWKTRRQGGL